MPKVTKSSDGKGDAVVNTETGEETATFDDVLRPVFSPLGVAELTGKKAEYRKVGFANPHLLDDRSARASDERRTRRRRLHSSRDVFFVFFVIAGPSRRTVA